MKKKNPHDETDCSVYIKSHTQDRDTERRYTGRTSRRMFLKNVNTVCFEELKLGVIYITLLFCIARLFYTKMF